MIITKISDGFGNQLFQYAFGYAVSRRLGTKMELDISVLDNHKTRKFELNMLNIEPHKIYSYKRIPVPTLRKIARKFLKFKISKFFTMFNEKTPWTYDPDSVNIKDNTYIEGFWQTEKYFSEYRKELLNLFSPKYKMSAGAQMYKKEVESCTSVSVHIRRGDYVKTGICVDDEYYINAIRIMEKEYPEACYFVFSDDLDYAEALIKRCNVNRYKIVRYESDTLTLDDFFIMAACKANIIANSSFSWWAAWLNRNIEKKVVCPVVGNWRGDFYPENWTKIEMD